MLTNDIDFGKLEFMDETEIRLDEEVRLLKVDDTKVTLKYVTGCVEIYPMHRIKCVWWVPKRCE